MHRVAIFEPSEFLSEGLEMDPERDTIGLDLVVYSIASILLGLGISHPNVWVRTPLVALSAVIYLSWARSLCQRYARVPQEIKSVPEIIRCMFHSRKIEALACTTGRSRLAAHRALFESGWSKGAASLYMKWGVRPEAHEFRTLKLLTRRVLECVVMWCMMAVVAFAFLTFVFLSPFKTDYLSEAGTLAATVGALAGLACIIQFLSVIIFAAAVVWLWSWDRVERMWCTPLIALISREIGGVRSRKEIYTALKRAGGNSALAVRFLMDPTAGDTHWRDVSSMCKNRGLRRGAED